MAATKSPRPFALKGRRVYYEMNGVAAGGCNGRSGAGDLVRVGTAAGVVVLGSRDEGRAGALQEVLAARGRAVTAAPRWPAARLVDLAAEEGADVLVLDGALSSEELRTVARSVETRTGPAVLLVGPVRPNSEVLVALACGISGYIDHDSQPEAIADAVDALCAGGLVVPRVTTLPLVAHLREGGRRIVVDRPDGTEARLTHREWEVLVLLRQGYTTGEIADVLVVSGTTVRSHVAALVRKLGAPDRGGLAEPPKT